MIPIGEYTAKATRGEFSTSSKKGTEQAQVTFRIEDGAHKGEEIDWVGFLTEKTEQSTLDALMLCGWDGSDFVSMSGVTKNQVRLVVEHETFTTQSGEEKTRARVRWVNSLSRGGKPIEGPALQDFATRMKGKVLAAKERAKKNAEAADDFPFGANEPKF